MSNLPPRIPFHQRFIEAVESGEKRFTLRVDPGYTLEAGKEAWLMDYRGNKIRTARICLVAHVPLSWIPHWQFQGHREYDSSDDLIEELEEYYPDTYLDPDTPITVIGW